ncbi:MAG TPA: hypothetical protein VKF36_25295 [Syntrophorhabdales bacterium]|nr:hypothetical protein [Syntrophorhabdales bacterium]
MQKRIPVSIMVVVLIISLAIFVRWMGERNGSRSQIVASSHADVLRGALGNNVGKKEHQIDDCDAWAGMNVKEKKRNYRANPKRWTRCLCEEEGCELDRLYITGKLSRW